MNPAIQNQVDAALRSLETERQSQNPLIDLDAIKIRPNFEATITIRGAGDNIVEAQVETKRANEGPALKPQSASGTLKSDPNRFSSGKTSPRDAS